MPPKDSITINNFIGGSYNLWVKHANSKPRASVVSPSLLHAQKKAISTDKVVKKTTTIHTATYSNGTKVTIKVTKKK